MSPLTLIYNADFFPINYGNQRFFSIRKHHKCRSHLFPLHLNIPMSWGHYNCFTSFSVSIVFRRQDLMCKVDPRALRVNFTVDYMYISLLILLNYRTSK